MRPFKRAYGWLRSNYSFEVFNNWSTTVFYFYRNPRLKSVRKREKKGMPLTFEFKLDNSLTIIINKNTKWLTLFASSFTEVFCNR